MSLKSKEEIVANIIELEDEVTAMYEEQAGEDL